MVYLFLFFNSRNYCPNNRGLDHIESLTKKLHHPKEKTVRVTIDIPEQMYMKTIQEKVSVRRFFLNLLQANLNQSIDE